MSKSQLITALSVTILLFVTGLVLGNCSTNYFPIVGLVLSLGSSVITICITFQNSVKARRAATKVIGPFAPISAKRMSQLSGTILPSDPIKNLQKQLDELRKDHEELAKYVDNRVETVFFHVQKVHARLTQHREVELPQILSTQSGTIIFGAFLSLTGAVVISASEHLYNAFSQLAKIGISLAI